MRYFEGVSAESPDYSSVTNMAKMGNIVIPPLRKLAGVFLIMIILAIFLSLYFFKYVPSEQKDFHHNAFLELKQVETALQERNKAYVAAIQNFLKRQGAVDFAPLTKYFTYTNYRDAIHPEAKLVINANYTIGDIKTEQDKLTRKWKIVYSIYDNKEKPVAGLSKSIDSMMTNLVTAYRDIFNDYLLIKDKHLRKNGSLKEKKDEQHDTAPPDDLHEGQIIFNSGSLSVDYLVNTDSLLKKNDGFSLLNVHDVTIEGNPYKLFLYPIEMGEERIILAGLISLDHYNQGFKKIPFNLIALAGILVLLILIHLPILKIYILGPYERIRDIDIRLIIGTYFVAAFVGFFLFSNSFLNQADQRNNQNRLKKFSREVQKKFTAEVDSICKQLKEFDNRFYTHIEQSKPVPANTKLEDYMQRSYFPSDSFAISSIFKPSSYPYLNNLFWIDSTGKWVARWGFKKLYSKTPLIKIDDRKYFTDFINNQNLILRDTPNYQFTIQPTLSRLDGEYTITVVVQSDSSKANMFKKKWKSALPPYLVGMGTQMNFVSNSILPPGYSFSIINEEGEILYDSKPGRALLSNILKEVDDPLDILQCARNRNTRYFSAMMLRGRQIAMQATPLDGFPYTMLTYYNVSQTEDIYEHLVSLSAILMGFILLLLISSALVNQWSKKRNVLLQAPWLNFEWLYPARTKVGYYRHLLGWMAALLAIYFLSWVIIEIFFTQHEFSLFFITLLFPFYVLLHYYLIREKYYYGIKIKQPAKSIPMPLAVLLGIILIIINGYAFEYASSILLVLLTQFLLCIAVTCSVLSLKPPGKPDEETKDEKFLRPYSLAIVVGVVLISVIPALGIICVLLRQETSLESNSTRLDMARMINSRSIELNQRIKDYNFPLADSSYNFAFYKLKFQYGIYSLTGDSVYTVPPFFGQLAQTISPGYIRLHQWFFPEGGISARANPPNIASDSSWYFFTDTTGFKKLSGSELVYQNGQDGITKRAFRMDGDFSTNWNAAHLMFNDVFSSGSLYIFLYFGTLLLSLFLAYKLTRSLAKRIFLINLDIIRDPSKDKRIVADDLIRLLPKYKELHELLASADQEDGKNKNDSASPGTAKGEMAPGSEASSKPGTVIDMKYIFQQENLLADNDREDKILEIGKLMKTIYWKAWIELSSREKFILFDFAIDGFTNYKNAIVINELLQKKVLSFIDGRLVMMSLSFREFVLSESDDPNVASLADLSAKKDSWKQFKIPLLIVLSLIGLFIFITQDMIYQKITGLFTSLGSLVPLFGTILSNGNGSHAEKKE